ncbi:hypothetical protein M441DRAFT_215013 [Trichoderma asperellum CBS 433.97]|uniref:Uncharacterized protein n=1 Tax=Trichoderma asperellum (strain ATCC 204424 / CBS 433.97 / NBRC 101777) TaxID=1042311 RepID=A0A2T3ZNM1_TRIA4|nr:hypothetical protein M441DRAFT_215013 [Trichoderma asperellum CBS 433.97]PTB46396.1 hypothetical protein M441DRAFT_215013 [Trichoderma asperellum CBS 433.97]
MYLKCIFQCHQNVAPNLLRRICNAPLLINLSMMQNLGVKVMPDVVDNRAWGRLTCCICKRPLHRKWRFYSTETVCGISCIASNGFFPFPCCISCCTASCFFNSSYIFGDLQSKMCRTRCRPPATYTATWKLGVSDLT